MSRGTYDYFHAAKLHVQIDELTLELEQAEAELAERMGEIQAFEAEVEAKLGFKINKLDKLEKEITRYLEIIDKIRLGEKPVMPVRNAPHFSGADTQAAASGEELKRIRLRDLYRKLVRRYHPDLALDENDLTYRSRWMLVVNRAYAENDLEALEALDAGIFPEAVERTAGVVHDKPGKGMNLVDDLAAVKERLAAVRRQLENLHRHPSVQLSLDVKLARREDRDLLAELSNTIDQKIERKLTERDFLRLQLAQAGLKV